MPELHSSNLDKRCTFEDFIVTPDNLLAYEASLKVALHPGEIYNPLVICSPVGAGKTRLLHAIGNRAQDTTPGLRVRFITFVQFTNDVINAIRNRDVANLRESYHKVELLLLDGFTFLAKKERTQEELFHICNALYEQKRQIVIACYNPSDIYQGYSKNLQSLLTRGLTVSIQSLSCETKKLILMRRAAAKRVELPEEVAAFIVNEAGSNVRLMDGFLDKLINS